VNIVYAFYSISIILPPRRLWKKELPRIGLPERSFPRRGFSFVERTRRMRRFMALLNIGICPALAREKFPISLQ